MSEVFYGKDLAKYKLDRAKEEYDTAQLLFDNDKLKASNNRAYYAIYHALTAVLCLEPIAFKKHKDTIAHFNKNYVHGGTFSGDIGRKIAKSAKIRHASDYDEFYIASREEAENQINTANEIISAIEAHLQSLEMETIE